MTERGVSLDEHESYEHQELSEKARRGTGILADAPLTKWKGLLFLLYIRVIWKVTSGELLKIQ
jgi:hypothetical protein